MTCYYPLPAKKHICKQSGLIQMKVYSMDKAGTLGEDEFAVGCGVCIGCRLERSRQWAMRCMHEAQGHEENCFVTLTYDENTMPYSLVLKDVQKFMKRLRGGYSPKKIRFYMCGEYAPVRDEYGRVVKDNKKRELKGRPHYHILLFGHDFEDKVKWKIKKGHQLYRSEILESLWKKGHALIGAVTFDSAAYVARYIMKKYLGGTNKDKLEIYKGRDKEFTTMSRGGTGGLGGIGMKWIEEFGNGVYEEDRAIIKGKEVMPSKYYDKIYDLNEPEKMEIIKKKRVEEALKKAEDNTQYRLEVKEICMKSKIKTLTRNLERDI